MTYEKWAVSSLQATVTLLCGTYCAQILRKLVHNYISDRTLLPLNPYGNWNQTMLVNKDLAQDINLYLQELGKDITAVKVVLFLACPDIKEKHGITKKISLHTAQRYLHALGYHWQEAKKGQYVDGHEHADVVWDRDKVFIPKIKELWHRMQIFDKDRKPIDGVRPDGKCIVLWFHNESIFYAHDQRRKSWYHIAEVAKPYRKEEGASLMIADFFSANFGWLQSADVKRNGYFTMDNIIAQANEAMDILSDFGNDIEHVFIYDNATTHKKCADDEISACKMPRNTPPPGKNWLVDDATFNDAPQPLYFPEDHPCAGVFKGMATILQECGFSMEYIKTKKAECKGFKCASPAEDCYCCCILFNQLDFANIKSFLKVTCEACSVQVIFLPKFHCYAKRLYQLNPEFSWEDTLEKNALAALGEIPIVSMHRFVNCSLRFMDAYACGLNGRQAAWAARHYRGHQVLPDSILEELKKENII
ncbi:hypothetical protein ARMGADRAFT_1045964 [Armillaria gallica]|uniref:Uncharacterized protein n=1 Tax=Armillaria gallica TaxID=47427 RepID=A0A2H3DI28_ARMGA|nr:hypothetical protein ARMGADRAFT_1045964 [Armillaria gallica]